MQVIPLPTVRLRHALRVTAVVTSQCQACGHVADLDVIALACGYGPCASIRHTVKLLSCPCCGAHGAGLFQVFGGPSLARYEFRFGDLIEPAAELVAHCRACHRRRVLNALEIGQNPKVGPEVVLSELADRLRCEGCGQRGWVRIHLRT